MRPSRVRRPGRGGTRRWRRPWAAATTRRYAVIAAANPRVGVGRRLRCSGSTAPWSAVGALRRGRGSGRSVGATCPAAPAPRVLRPMPSSASSSRPRRGTCLRPARSARASRNAALPTSPRRNAAPAAAPRRRPRAGRGTTVRSGSTRPGRGPGRARGGHVDVLERCVHLLRLGGSLASSRAAARAAPALRVRTRARLRRSRRPGRRRSR